MEKHLFYRKPNTRIPVEPATRREARRAESTVNDLIRRAKERGALVTDSATLQAEKTNR